MRVGAQRDRLSFTVRDDDGASLTLSRPIGADAILLSSMPGGAVRVRAFYPALQATLAIHRVGVLGGAALLRGSRVAERLRGTASHLAVPIQHERGRRLRHAWVVEELFAGTRTTRRDWPTLFPRVAEGVVTLWEHADLRPVSRRRMGGRLTWDEVSAQIAAMQLEPASARPLREGIEALERTDGTVLVGWTHGDPVPNNVIRWGDRRLGLIDWERAGRNPIGLDVCRMLAALVDPGDAIQRLDDLYRPDPRVLSLRIQAAIALVGLLPTWAAQAAAWREAGREKGYRIRNRRRLRLLEHLLET